MYVFCMGILYVEMKYMVLQRINDHDNDNDINSSLIQVIHRIY